MKQPQRRTRFFSPLFLLVSLVGIPATVSHALPTSVSVQVAPQGTVLFKLRDGVVLPAGQVVTVLVTPSDGASGSTQGQSALSIDSFPHAVKLPAGKYTLVINKPDWTSQTKTIQVSPNAEFTLEVGDQITRPSTGGNIASLPRDPNASRAFLFVSAPPESTISVDGAPPQPASQVFTFRDPGTTHSVTVTMPCGGDKYETTTYSNVETSPGAYRILSVSCKNTVVSKWGTLKLALPTGGLPSNATLLLDGQPIPLTMASNSTGITRPVGPFDLVVVIPGVGERHHKGSLASLENKTVAIQPVDPAQFVAVNSTPPGASVSLAGKPLGSTPFVAPLPPGSHTLSFELGGYQPATRELPVSFGGSNAVLAALARKKLSQEQDPVEMRKDMSTQSAAVLPMGGWAVNVFGGYPTFVGLGFQLGAYRTSDGTQGIDFGLGFNTIGTNNEFSGRLRAQIMSAGPVMLGLDLSGGGGVGPRGRNTGYGSVKMPLTFRGGSVVKFTAGIGAEVYSDRYCPSQESILEEIGKDRNGNPDPAGVQRVLDKYNALTQAEHLGDRCLGRGYNKDAPGSTSSNPIGFPNPIEAVARGTYDPNNPLFQVNGTPVLDDFLGLRFWVYAALEVAISEKVNFFAEGGFYPGTQRLLHTDAFNRAFPENDLGFSVRAGITAKFFGGATAKK